MQSTWSLGLGLLFLSLILPSARADTNQAPPPPAARLHFPIRFVGYQQLDGGYVFQLYFPGLPPSAQPPLKKTGDALGYEGYIIGPFHQVKKPETDPQTHLTTMTDESVLELDKPGSDLKIMLPFRIEIDLSK